MKKRWVYLLILAATSYWWTQPIFAIILMPSASLWDIRLSVAILAAAYILALVYFKRFRGSHLYSIDFIESRILPGWKVLYGIILVEILFSLSILAYAKFGKVELPYWIYWSHHGDPMFGEHGIVLVTISNITGDEISQFALNNDRAPLPWPAEETEITTHFWNNPETGNRFIAVIDGKLTVILFPSYFQSCSQVKIILSRNEEGIVNIEVDVPPNHFSL